MDGAGRGHARRRAKTVQRDPPRARQHFATDADLDAAGAGARRPGHAHGVPHHSAPRRLRVDEARTFVARAGEQSRPVGAEKPFGHRSRTTALRRGDAGALSDPARSSKERAAMAANPPVVVVEDDPWTRLIGVVLDPATSAERRAAFADFMSPDEPDFAGWCDALRARVGRFYPGEVRLVPSQAELRANLAPARALVVESFAVGGKELGCAPQLKVVHKYGAMLRNIDVAACAAAGVKVLTVRRRANIACAEHAFALMLTLARRMHRIGGLSSVEQLAAAKLSYKPFDRRHAPGANWARISGTR